MTLRPSRPKSFEERIAELRRCISTMERAIADIQTEAGITPADPFQKTLIRRTFARTKREPTPQQQRRAEYLREVGRVEAEA